MFTVFAKEIRTKNTKRVPKNKMLIVGLCGSKGVGKDTCADYLVSRYGFHKISFAGPLKQVCRDLFLFTEEQCTDPTRKEVVDERWGISPRQAFQMIGTDWVRSQFDTLFWIHRIKWELQNLSGRHDKIVISDVRFENEKDFVHHDMSGHMLGITRSPCSLYSANDPHPSEVDCLGFWDSLDTVLKNDDTPESFYKKIDAWYESILEKTNLKPRTCD